MMSTRLFWAARLPELPHSNKKEGRRSKRAAQL